jgi:hypothetical protein
MESLIIQDAFQAYFDDRDVSRPKPVHTKQLFGERGQNPVESPPQAGEMAKDRREVSSKNGARDIVGTIDVETTKARTASPGIPWSQA